MAAVGHLLSGVTTLDNFESSPLQVLTVACVHLTVSLLPRFLLTSGLPSSSPFCPLLCLLTLLFLVLFFLRFSQFLLHVFRLLLYCINNGLMIQFRTCWVFSLFIFFA